MARKERGNQKLREMMEEYGVKTMEDVHAFVKMLTAETIRRHWTGSLRAAGVQV